jgi:hypothetical protein
VSHSQLSRHHVTACIATSAYGLYGVYGYAHMFYITHLCPASFVSFLCLQRCCTLATLTHRALHPASCCHSSAARSICRHTREWQPCFSKMVSACSLDDLHVWCLASTGVPFHQQWQSC